MVMRGYLTGGCERRHVWAAQLPRLSCAEAGVVVCGFLGGRLWPPGLLLMASWVAARKASCLGHKWLKKWRCVSGCSISLLLLMKLMN